MSSTTKKKYVVNEVLQNYELPNEKRYIVKVSRYVLDRSWAEPQTKLVQIVAPRGNHLHEVSTPCGRSFLVTMPTKFRNTIFIKRGDDCRNVIRRRFILFIQGDFVLVEDIEEGDKVKAEIVRILLKDNIKYIRSQNCWLDNWHVLSGIRSILTDSSFSIMFFRPAEFEADVKNELNVTKNDLEDMMPPMESSDDEQEDEQEQENDGDVNGDENRVTIDRSWGSIQTEIHSFSVFFDGFYFQSIVFL